MGLGKSVGVTEARVCLQLLVAPRLRPTARCIVTSTLLCCPSCRVVPVTSYECERSVSRLRRLRTYLRVTTRQDRLNGLALMHTHYGPPIGVPELVDMCARKLPRRMLLLDILSD